jgi:hypothetical protein
MITDMAAIGVITGLIGYLVLAVVLAAVAVALLKRMQSRSRGETTSQAAVRRHREAEEGMQRAAREEAERRRGGER